MGAGNVAVVLGLSPYLTDKPFRALAQMALTSQDGELIPCYWGGWEKIAEAVGSVVPRTHEKKDGTDLPAGKTCRGCKRCKAPREAARSAVAWLLGRGFIRYSEREEQHGGRAGFGRQAADDLMIHSQREWRPARRYGSGPPRRTVAAPADDCTRLGLEQSPVPEGGSEADSCSRPSLVQLLQAEPGALLQAEPGALLQAEPGSEEKYRRSAGTGPGDNSSQVSTSPGARATDDQGDVSPVGRPEPAARPLAAEGGEVPIWPTLSGGSRAEGARSDARAAAVDLRGAAAGAGAPPALVGAHGAVEGGPPTLDLKAAVRARREARAAAEAAS